MVLNNFQKSFDTQKVLRLLGAKHGRRASTASLRRINVLSDEIEGLISPRLCFRVLDLSEVDPGGIRLSDGTRLKSPKIAKALTKAESVCCFVATVGPAVDMEIQRLLQRCRYADAYVLDAMGSMATEHVVEQFFRRMAGRQNQKGGAATLRFSPGYCDWPIQDQQPLFKVLNQSDKLGVVLSDKFLMSPRKSVSGLFGLLPPGVKGAPVAYNPCNTCDKRDCIARRSIHGKSLQPQLKEKCHHA